MHAVDCIGTPIVEGTVITYPCRRSSDIWVGVGVVLEILPANDRWHPPRFRIERLRGHYNRITRPEVILENTQWVTALPLTADEARQRLQTPG